MPRVKVVLKNGTEVLIEGANDASWAFEDLAKGARERSLILTVFYREPNKTEVRGRFRPEEVVGYSIDPA